MPAPVFDSFLGYVPDGANSPFNSAVAGKNFVIHRHRDKQKVIPGWIELAQGYAKKFTALPANDTTIRKISSLSLNPQIYNLYIPEHGGQNVTVVTGTYTKTAFFPASPTVSTSGIWIRPYWNGSSWVDAWRELTEFFIFEIDALGTGGDNRKLYLDDASASKYGFKTIDPTGTVFTADYFKDWTIVYYELSSMWNHWENFDLVYSSGYDTDRYYLQLLPGHLNTDFVTHTAGDKIYVFRNLPYGKMFPASLSTFIYGLLSEARISTGNAATDLVASVAQKTVSFVGLGTNAYTKAIDAVVSGPGTLDVWKYAAVFGVGPDADGGDSGFDLGTYYFKYSIVMDDGSETQLYTAVTCDTDGTWDSDGGYITITSANRKIKVFGFRSWGALPPRARYLRVYMSNDNTDFHRVKDYDLRSETEWEESGNYGYDVLEGNHYYAVAGYTTATYIVVTDWTSEGQYAGVDAATQRGGMATTDSGVIQFANACVVGRRTFAFQVRAGGTLYPNHVFVSPSNGDGGLMFDVFPLLGALMLDLEYNDGDQLICGYPARDDVLAFKRRSAIKITAGGEGTSTVFYRDAITKSDGICSAKSLADLEDVVYWAGYNGVYSYSNVGVKLLNEDWLEEWKAISSTYKEAAVGVIDRTNRQYRLAFQTGSSTYCERILDLDTGLWTPAVLTNQPTAFAANQREGTIDFFSGTLIQTLGGGTLHDGTNFTMEYQTNDFIASQHREADALLQDIRIAYYSSVALTVTLYKDGTAQTPVTLAAGDGASIIKAGLSFRCKRFSVKISATTTAASQTVQIYEIVPRFQLIGAGVSRAVFASNG